MTRSIKVSPFPKWVLGGLLLALIFAPRTFAASLGAVQGITASNANGGGVTSVGVPADLSSTQNRLGAVTIAHTGQTCTATTCTVTAGFVNGNAASNNVAVDLPASNATFNPVEICKTDSSANTVTITPNGTDTLNGAASFALSKQYQCAQVIDAAVGNWTIKEVAYPVAQTLASHNFATMLSASGILSGARPASTDLSDLPIPVSSGGTQCGAPTTYASLPASPTNGEICNVIDANACTAGTAVSGGGGSTKCQVTYNGTSWMPAGGAVSSASGGFTTAGTGLANSGSTVSLVTPVTVANGGTQCGAPVAYASLPGSATNGEICNVTDATACTAGTAVSVGGGSTKCQVVYNGSSWMPAGGASAPTVTDTSVSFTDNTTNNASTAKHGFLLKLTGSTSNFLRADGTWAAPGGDGTGITGLNVPPQFSTSGTSTVTIANAGQVCTASSCSVTTGFVYGNATSNNVAVNLPASSGSYNPVDVCKTDSSANTVTVSPNGTDTIDGAANFVINSQNRCVHVVDATSGNWLVRSSFLIRDVRIGAPFPSNVTPTANVAYQMALDDSTTFPANFAATFIDPTSYGICSTNPTTYPDAWNFQCGSTYFSSVVFSTSGTASFATGTRPFVASSTIASPGANGGAISAPSTAANGHELILIVGTGNGTSCASAPSITPASGSNAFTAPSGNSHANANGDTVCIYTRLVTSTAEPASYSYSVTGSYPKLMMLDVVNENSSTIPDAIQFTDDGGTATATLNVPSTTGLSSSQDLLIGVYQIDGGIGASFSSTASLQQLQFGAFVAGTNYGGFIGILPLTASSSSTQASTYSTATKYVGAAIAIAPATNGGTASCAANNLVKFIAPATVSGICPITLVGHGA